MKFVEETDCKKKVGGAKEKHAAAARQKEV